MTNRALNGSGKRPKPGTRPLDVQQSRNVSIYIPKKWTILWNAFVDYMVLRRGRRIGTAILEAVLFYISRLDEDDRQAFRASLKRVAEEAAAECKSAAELADHILLPGEDIETLLKARTDRAIKRRRELYEEGLRWYVGDDISDYEEDLRFLDSPG